MTLENIKMHKKQKAFIKNKEKCTAFKNCIILGLRVESR